jgi:apolipoprotein N-acyltransferase
MRENQPLAARVGMGLILAVASAILITLAFPPYDLGWLIWVAFIPMLAAQYRILPPRLTSLAPAISIGGWLGAFLLPIFGGRSLVMALLPLGIAITVLFTDKDKRAFHERTAYRWFALEGALGWVGLEMFRSLTPALGTWGFVGYTLWSAPWLLQPLSLVGIYALDLLILLGNYALAQFLFLFIGSPDAVPLSQPQAARCLIIFLTLLGAWIGLSLGLYTAQPADVPIVRVAAIQPNLPRAAHLDKTITSEQRLTLLSEQIRVAADAGAQLIVLPEMIFNFDPQTDYADELQSLAAETNAFLVIGYVLDTEQGFRNEATVLSPVGDFLGVYGKTHPMITSGEPPIVSAGPYPVYDTPLGKLATMICFDADFTDVSRQYGRQGVQLIANPSLFGSPLAKLTYTQIIFRAIENHTAIVMADAGFNSAIVDSYGRVIRLSITPDGEQAALVADIPLGTGNTLYSRCGDWVGWLSMTGMIYFIVLMRKQLVRKIPGGPDRPLHQRSEP